MCRRAVAQNQRHRDQGALSYRRRCGVVLLVLVLAHGPLACKDNESRRDCLVGGGFTIEIDALQQHFLPPLETEGAWRLGGELIVVAHREELQRDASLADLLRARLEFLQSSESLDSAGAELERSAKELRLVRTTCESTS